MDVIESVNSNLSDFQYSLLNNLLNVTSGVNMKEDNDDYNINQNHELTQSERMRFRRVAFKKSKSVNFNKYGKLKEITVNYPPFNRTNSQAIDEIDFLNEYKHNSLKKLFSNNDYNFIDELFNNIDNEKKAGMFLTPSKSLESNNNPFPSNKLNPQFSGTLPSDSNFNNLLQLLDNNSRVEHESSQSPINYRNRKFSNIKYQNTNLNQTINISDLDEYKQIPPWGMNDEDYNKWKEYYYAASKGEKQITLAEAYPYFRLSQLPHPTLTAMYKLLFLE